MSKWTGKCDFCDHLEIIGADENFDEYKNNTKLSILTDRGEKPIKFEKYEDLIPYFSHIIILSAYSDGKRTEVLSSKSWLETDNYCPTTYRLKMMKDFQEYVRKNGKEPLWVTPPEEIEKWVRCPIGEPYFCEFKIMKNGDNGKKEHICPYMYCKKKKDGEICKLRYWREKHEK